MGFALRAACHARLFGTNSAKESSPLFFNVSVICVPTSWVVVGGRVRVMFMPARMERADRFRLVLFPCKHMKICALSFALAWARLQRTFAGEVCFVTLYAYSSSAQQFFLLIQVGRIR